MGKFICALTFAVLFFVDVFYTVSGEELTYSVKEEQPDNTFIGNVLSNSSTLASIGDTTSLKFSLLSRDDREDYEQYFKINEISSVLSTNVKPDGERLDRESVCPFRVSCELSLVVAARSDIRNIFLTIDITIIVLDINDNDPHFLSGYVTKNVSESAPYGTLITIAEGVRDADTSPEYSISGFELDPSSVPFSLNYTKKLDHSYTVKLKVISALDRETKDSYTLDVIAKDGGDKTARLTVNLNILDENDNQPEFNSTSYNVTVPETVVNGSVIATVTATDKDSGENGRIIYRLSTNQPREVLKHFDINETSGEIRVIATMEYNPGKAYVIIVEAMGVVGQTSAAQTKVTVIVLDIRNSRPEINVNLLPGPNVSSVSEYANVGAVVAHVDAIDEKDTGRNAEVTCTIENDVPGEKYFSLQRYDQNEYKVTVAKPLDREQKRKHRLTVTCADNGVPSLNSSASFTVHINDENDNPPRFTQQKYFASIHEGNEIGDSIITVSAYDLDTGVNGDFIYTVQASQNYVYVDEVYGVVRAKMKFDRETKPFMNVINVTVYARDRGSPSLTGSSVVLIEILDKNDMKPTFNQTTMRFWVGENKPNGTVVGVLFAYDKDEGDNKKITFSMWESYKATMPFVVFSNGLVKTKTKLDREETQEYHFRVVATDGGQPALESFANVIVYVLDENDETPAITQPSPENNTLVLPYLTSTQSIIYRVIALDSDEDGNKNSELEYSMLDLNNSHHFMLDSGYGDLYLERPVSDPTLIGKTFVLSITVKDKGDKPRNSSSLLRILIASQNVTTIPTPEDKTQNFLIAIIVAAVTIVLSVLILALICVIRKLDSNKRPTQNTSSPDKPDNMYNKNLALYSNSSDNSLFTEKKKKEVSFSLEDQNAMNQVGKSYGMPSHSLQQDFPEQTILQTMYHSDTLKKLDDAPSDCSGDSGTADSGRGGSDEDVQNIGKGLDVRKKEKRKANDVWFGYPTDSSNNSQQTLQTFSPRYTTPSPIQNQKIIPFSFKKTPSYPGVSGSIHSINSNTLTVPGSPPQYNTVVQPPSSFADDSKSSVYLSMDGLRADVSSDIVV